MKRDYYLIGSMSVLFIYILLALFTHFGWIAKDFAFVNTANTFASPSFSFWMGTDFLGRSVLSRALHGIRIAMLVGFFSALIAVFVGSLLGVVAGYFGGVIDDVIVWLYTTLDSVPSLLLLSAFAFCFDRGLIPLYFALGLTGWVRLCRLLRAETIKLRALEFVQAAQAIGFSDLKIIFTEIFPQLTHIILIQFTLNFIFAIKSEVILSFLGLGVEPGTPSWGVMINDAKSELARGIWWNLFAATFFMFFLILALIVFSDRIRRVLQTGTDTLYLPNEIKSL